MREKGDEALLYAFPIAASNTKLTNYLFDFNGSRDDIAIVVLKHITIMYSKLFG